MKSSKKATIFVNNVCFECQSLPILIHCKISFHVLICSPFLVLSYCCFPRKQNSQSKKIDFCNIRLNATPTMFVNMLLPSVNVCKFWYISTSHSMFWFFFVNFHYPLLSRTTLFPQWKKISANFCNITPTKKTTIFVVRVRSECWILNILAFCKISLLVHLVSIVTVI